MANVLGDLLNEHEQLKRQHNMTKHELIQARQTIERQSKQIDNLHQHLRVIELRAMMIQRNLSQVLDKLGFIQRTIASYYKRLHVEDKEK